MTVEKTSGNPIWIPEDAAALAAAVRLLEHPGFAARITSLVGRPIEAGLERLPQSWQQQVQKASRAALEHALGIALKTLDGRPPRFPNLSRRLHGAAVAGTGAVGGAFGLLALPLELPVTTGIMLRAIASIAAAEGEDLARPAARLSCLEVFALGGPTRGDDATEAGYFAVRTALARSVSQAAEFIVEKGIAEEGAPVLLRLITQVAQRFSVQVGEKLAAELVPILGAVGGATINVVFIDHFQSMARGHFAVRRLERKYGAIPVQTAYAAQRARG